jgi:hypothetical protein
MAKKKYLIAAMLFFYPCAIMAGRCTGSANCTECKNCSSCKHCNRDGGSCGVCATIESGSEAADYEGEAAGGVGETVNDEVEQPSGVHKSTGGGEDSSDWLWWIGGTGAVMFAMGRVSRKGKS